MRFLMLIPGTGHYYCGSCLRDDALASALREAGHDVDVAPLYLPMVLERPDGEPAVQMGGINVYLQQRTRLFRRLPRWMTRPLDHPRLLRWASRRGDMTDARSLGELTLGVLLGETGPQRASVDALLRWVAEQPRPDVVVLSNAMLIGLAAPIKRTLQRPVVVTLQGELPFLDSLPQPYRDQAWGALAAAVSGVDRLVAVSGAYRDAMAARLGLRRDDIAVVHNGIDTADFAAAPPRLVERQPPTVGYLARLSRDKGLADLVDAFIVLAKRGRVPGVRLLTVGVELAEDRALWREVRSRLARAGLADAVERVANASRDEKLRHLARMSVLSVPATYGESFGLYLLEAAAAGVPVVQPQDRVFAELIEATGGGVLCEPGNATALALALEDLLLDAERAQRLADAGRSAVLARFSAKQMASAFERTTRMIATTV